jgi:hypothetical protein
MLSADLFLSLEGNVTGTDPEMDKAKCIEKKEKYSSHCPDML